MRATQFILVDSFIDCELVYKEQRCIFFLNLRLISWSPLIHSYTNMSLGIPLEISSSMARRVNT